MNIYKGIRGEVTVNGEPLLPHLDIVSHSPTGFSWGYDGSGPAQLALAIMVNEFGRDLEKHPRPYQEFKREVISGLDVEFELLSSDISVWARCPVN